MKKLRIIYKAFGIFSESLHINANDFNISDSGEYITFEAIGLITRNKKRNGTNETLTVLKKYIIGYGIGEILK